MECADIGGLDTFKCRDVTAVDVLVEARRKRTSVVAPVVDCSMYLSCFSIGHRGFRVTLTAVVARATIGIGTSGSSNPGIDEW